MTNENSPETNDNKTVEVTQGRSSGKVRHILIISLILIVIAAYVLFA